MEEHKISNFRRSHPETQFPEFVQQDKNRLEEVRRGMCERLHLPSEASGLEIVRALRSGSRRITGLNALSDVFNLEGFVSRVVRRPPAEVLINWYRFDDMDIMGLQDLSNRLLDIWYPGSDDIDIIDPEYRWVLSIGYEGELFWWEP